MKKTKVEIKKKVTSRVILGQAFYQKRRENLIKTIKKNSHSNEKVDHQTINQNIQIEIKLQARQRTC